MCVKSWLIRTLSISPLDNISPYRPNPSLLVVPFLSCRPLPDQISLLSVFLLSSLKVKVKKVKARKVFHGQAISELRGVTEVRRHTVLLAAGHKRAHPALTPSSKAGTRFTYPGGMEG